MDAKPLIEVVFALVLGTVVFWAIVPQVQFHLRMLRSRRPIVQGTVQKGEVLHSGPTKWLQLPFRSLLGYAYQVNGQAYWGIFVLAAEDMQMAEKLQKQAEGYAVAVQYGPKKPEISFLVERELLGRRVVHDPMWLESPK
jgi:hypothetical protein